MTRIISMILCAVAAAASLATLYITLFDTQTSGRSLERTDLSVAEVIGGRNAFWGDPKASYTLVEFADYECPPCRAAAKKMPTLLQSQESNVRMVFRNFPLTKLHPNAMPAAVLAERASDLGKFPQVHKALITGYVDALGRSKVAAENAISVTPSQEKAIRLRIDRDVAEGRRMGVDGTPAFFLCSPKGTVYRLKRIEDLPTLLRSNLD